MDRLIHNPYWQNFMGHSANWYKMTILGFLILNPFLFSVDPYVAGWVLVLEFIFCLAMALKCYPLLPGGLLAFEALVLGMTKISTLEHEIVANLEVILLLVFMVAGIYFMKNLILFLFTKMLVHVRNKIALSVMFSLSAALLSAFLDALTVTAVIISIAIGFYSIYHKVASGKHFTHDHDHKDDESVEHFNRDDLEQFRSFLRSLMMHAAVGTALGGVCTLVGEPQNILIGTQAGWNFVEFFFRMAPVTLPVLVSGVLTCVLLEVTGKFGYGGKIPEKVMAVIADFDAYEDERRSVKDKASLVVQGLVGIWLVVGLLFHFAPVGIIGLSVIVLGTVLTGMTEEHQIGHAFEEALPFTALLVVFFTIVGVIADQDLFAPITNFVLAQEGSSQVTLLYAANGLLSAISDNVFVATVYVSEMVKATVNGVIDRDTFDMLAVAINTGTNIPSVATPNGQAAFLFLLTSAVAPLIRLSYMKMVIMALPYTIVMSIVGYLMVAHALEPMTKWMYDQHLINHHSEMPGQAGSGASSH